MEGKDLKEKKDLFRAIPSVDQLLGQEKIKALYENTSHHQIVECIRQTLEQIRQQIEDLSQEEVQTFALSEKDLLETITDKLASKKVMNLRPVINATGVVLHTNLGRSLLSPEIKEAVWSVASQYSTLEINLETGKRGSRYDHVDQLLCKITGAESAMVVNNNAAAVTLVLSALAKDKEVIVSRGELVEIGGSFRIPEVMEQSGAHLVEVGATNKTKIKDYENAIGENTGALLKVHTSNYRILGFTQSVSSEDLVALAREKNIPALEDVGSGVLVDLTPYGFSQEPTVQSILEAGMDIVTFSGDKLLGGPQAGIIVGGKSYIDALRNHPLNRAFRIDKLTLVALEATLKIYDQDQGQGLLNRIPTLRMLTESQEVLQRKALELENTLKEAIGDFATIGLEESFSQVGGGALPLEKLPTYALSLSSEKYSASQLEERLRKQKKPIFTRISKDKVYFDVRTLFNQDIEIIGQTLKNIFAR